MTIDTANGTPHFLTVLIAGTVLVLGGRSAAAAEYCVTCAGPAAMYACAIEGMPADAAPDPRMQLICIQELARQGGHETCSVPRSAPTPCPGVMRVVAIPEGQQPIKTLPVETDAGGAEPAASQPVPVEGRPEKPVKEPKTVEELASQTVEASKKGLKKAGDAVTGTAEKAGEGVENAGSAVGNAAKKTWHCLKSLFSDC